MSRFHSITSPPDEKTNVALVFNSIKNVKTNYRWHKTVNVRAIFFQKRLEKQRLIPASPVLSYLIDLFDVSSISILIEVHNRSEKLIFPRSSPGSERRKHDSLGKFRCQYRWNNRTNDISLICKTVTRAHRFDNYRVNYFLTAHFRLSSFFFWSGEIEQNCTKWE